MFEIKLKNNKSFLCDDKTTIFNAAKKSNIHLEHSCLSARCSSCIAKVISGETEVEQNDLILTDVQRENNYVLTCNTIPKSNLKLDLEDLGDITIYEKKVFPSKISLIEELTEDVVKIVLRLPPNIKFKFNAGQYVNLIKNNINRSYSLANYAEDKLEFFIKNYKGGLMSNYWFNEAKINDLIRVEGPLGTFFLRDSKKENIIFLGTGTGVAPIKSILDKFEGDYLSNIKDKKIWAFIGNRFAKDLFWKPNYKNVQLNFVNVLSRETDSFSGFKGYVQDAVLDKNIDLENSQVYACGSSQMIEASKKIFTENKLEENHFFSDAFVQTN